MFEYERYAELDSRQSETIRLSIYSDSVNALCEYKYEIGDDIGVSVISFLNINSIEFYSIEKNIDFDSEKISFFEKSVDDLLYQAKCKSEEMNFYRYFCSFSGHGILIVESPRLPILARDKTIMMQLSQLR